MPRSINPDNILKGEWKAGSIICILLKKQLKHEESELPGSPRTLLKALARSLLTQPAAERNKRHREEEGSSYDAAPPCRALLGTRGIVIPLDPGRRGRADPDPESPGWAVTDLRAALSHRVQPPLGGEKPGAPVVEGRGSRFT